MCKQKIHIVVVTSVVLMAGVLAVILGLHNRSQNDTPIPFLQQEGIDLRGQLTTIGYKQTIEVVRVTFPAGTDAETLQQDKVYLVSVPDDPNVPNIPLDQAMALSGGGTVDYFGYKYLSADAAVEKQNREDTSFLVRFPGQFFASAKARTGISSGTIAAFEQRTGITMHSTDTGGVVLESNALYLIIVNEAQSVTMTVRQTPQNPVCGNGAIETGETCDDGNTTPGNGCDTACQTETGYTCTGAPSTCVLSGNVLRLTSAQFAPLNVQRGDYSTGASLTARLENVSPFAVSNVVVTMPMPPAILSYPPVLSFRSAGEGATCSLSDGQLSCNLGDLQDSETKSLTLLFDVNILNNPYCLDHSTINAALSVASDTTDPVAGDDHVSAALTAGCPVDFGFVSAHFDPGAEKRGANPTLNIIVKNYGPVFDEKKIVFAALPADLTFVNPQSACRFEWGRLHCSTGPIAPGQTKTIWADFHIAGNFAQCSGEIPLTVDLSFFGGRPDPNPDNDSSRVTVTAVCPTPGADLDIGVQPPQQQPDQDVVFPVRVHNYGSDAASSIVVSHTLSDSVTFQSAQGADCNVQGNLLQCSLTGELDGVTQYGVGGEKNFSVTLRYPVPQNCGQSEEHRETFSVENAVSDPNPRNDSYTVFFETACPADLGMISARFDPVSAPSGTTTTFTVSVENFGSDVDDAYVNISGLNGNYFTTTSAAPFCDTDWDYLKGNYTKCWTGPLSPGESKLFSLTYRANSGLLCSADVPIAIDLSLDGQGNDQNRNNNTTRATVTWECPQQ